MAVRGRRRDGRIDRASGARAVAFLTVHNVKTARLAYRYRPALDRHGRPHQGGELPSGSALLFTTRHPLVRYSLSEPTIPAER